MEKDCQNTETGLEITNEWVNWLVYITINIYDPKKILHIGFTKKLNKRVWKYL